MTVSACTFYFNQQKHAHVDGSCDHKGASFTYRNAELEMYNNKSRLSDLRLLEG